MTMWQVGIGVIMAGGREEEGVRGDEWTTGVLERNEGDNFFLKLILIVK